jgi:subfamily B ATP-binding cassette protein MsbA
MAIARAIFRDRPILLLNEATSALDVKSEAIVQDALEHSSAGRATLVVANRLATVRNSHNIIEMDQGRIADEGSHKKLISHDGIYAVFYQFQLADTS